MGATRSAILADEGVRLGFVLCIEGYEYLLTDAGDTAKPLAAWTGTPWTQALPGLQIIGNIEQSFRPFDNDISPSSLVFRILPDEDDTFGRDVFQVTPQYSTRLDEVFDSGDGTITVRDTSRFPDDDGVVYMGTRRYSYSGRTATTFTVETAGEMAPFETDTGGANEFPGHHGKAPHDTIQTWPVTQPPRVSSSPPTWNGRMVGLWVHRIVGGTWDSKDDAELLFAGTIQGIQESGLFTEIQCESLVGKVADTVLLEDQWTAQPKEGYKLKAGQWFRVGVVSGDAETADSGKLTVVSGASGVDEIEPGHYTAAELASAMTDWLNSDSVVGQSGSDFTLSWSARVGETTGGFRFRLTMTEGTLAQMGLWLWASDSSLLYFLGFSDRSAGDDGSYTSTPVRYGGSWSVTGQEPPLRIMPLGFVGGLISGTTEIEIEGAAGAFMDTTDFAPPGAAESVSDDNGTTRWSFFVVGDRLLIWARLADDSSSIENIRTWTLAGIRTGLNDTSALGGVREGEAAPVIKQVAILSGSLGDIVTKLVASTDGNGTNHSTYDALPFGAAIPWGLLGSGWVDSMADLEQACNSDAISLVIEKPTKLWDAIKCDLMLRGAFLVWRDGGLQVGRLQTPNASSADWDLDEDNKAVQPGEDARTITQHTTEWLTNAVKIEYDRDPIADEYRSVYIVRDPASIDTYGLARPLTIKARNSYAASAGNGEAIEALAGFFASAVLPAFSRPLRRWRRSISHNLFLAAPGDTASVSDDFARNPTTGERGVSGRGTTVMSVSYSFGISAGGSQTYNGTIDLLYTEEDRLFPMAPCAEHDSSKGTDGWDSGTRRLYIKEHAFSAATEASDLSHFEAGDAVLIYALDDDAGTRSFADSLEAVGSDYFQFTTGFGDGGNPAFAGAAFTYRVTYDEYANAESNQALHAYQAGDDGLIDDSIEANLYGDDRIISFIEADATELPDYCDPILYGDGRPVHPGLLESQARMANNLLRYRTAPNMPMPRIQDAAAPTAGTRTILEVVPFYVGPMRPLGGRELALRLAPQFRVTASGSATLHVTSAGHPPHGDSYDDVTDAVRGAVQHVSWTTTSTTNVIPAAKDLRIVRSPDNPSLTYLIVEGEGDITPSGLVESWLKAVD